MGSIAELRRFAVQRLLEQEDYILLVINPLIAGVRLPRPLIEARQPIPIHIGYNMAIPAPDLTIDDEGISATLSFDRTPFACAFPWPSVMQISVGDEHLVWVAPVAEAELVEPPDDGGDRRPTGKAHLRLV